MLLPGHYDFIDWLAKYISSHQGKKPTNAEQIEVLEELLQVKVTEEALRKLRRRAEFKEYFNNLIDDRDKANVRKLKSKMPEAIDAHFKGLDMAVTAEDYRAIPAYTNPILDRVIPRRDALQAQQQVINIVLTPKQEALLGEETTVVEADWDELVDET